MASNRLPIAGYPHLALTAQVDDIVSKETLAGLRSEGFKVERGHLVPPEGASSQTVIKALTNAFTAATRR